MVILHSGKIPGSLNKGIPGSLNKGIPGSLNKGIPGSLNKGIPGSLNSCLSLDKQLFHRVSISPKITCTSDRD